MSSRRRRIATLGKQAHVQASTDKQVITHSDSIERIVEELLDNDGEDGRQLSATSTGGDDGRQAKPAALDESNILDASGEEPKCNHCKSYSPMLRNFLSHIASDHKVGISDAGITNYGCDICKMEFENPFDLGVHLLVHILGKAPSKDFDMLPLGDVNQEEVGQNMAAVEPNDIQSRSVGTQMATRMFTRLLGSITQVSQGQSDSGSVDKSYLEVDKDAEEVSTQGAASKEKTESTNVSVTDDILPIGMPKKRRGRPRKNQKPVAGEYLGPQIASLLQENEEPAMPRAEKTLSDLASLLPSLQEKDSTSQDKLNDSLVADSIVRPRACATSPFDRVSTTSDKSLPNDVVPRGIGQASKNSFEISNGSVYQTNESMEQSESDLGSQGSFPHSGPLEKKRRNAENQCIICLEKFATKELLKDHRVNVHGDQRKWVCEGCAKEFNSHWKYRDHCAKVHSNKKPFKCTECGKCLSSFTILATHVGLHSGARPHECNICGKRYLVAAGLKDHLIAHKNEREHRCPICTAGFNAKGDLKKHMVTHLPEKPHCCQICNAGFNRLASLQRHMRTHTGEKPFSCDICQKAFSRREKMLEHRRTHTGERPLVCTVCGKSFKDSSNFSNHKRIHQAGYVPRKRKRATAKEDSINSVIIPPDQPIVATTVTDIGLSPGIAAIAPEKPVLQQNKESALKDLATISTTIEDLQSASQEWLRQLLGAALDQNDVRNLINVQAAVSLPGNALNLSANDVRSLQLIINGAQARNVTARNESTPQVSQ